MLSGVPSAIQWVLTAGVCSQSLQSCLTLCDPVDCSPPGSSVHGDFPDKNPGVGYHALLQRIFPTQGLSPGLPHWGCILLLIFKTINLKILSLLGAEGPGKRD